MLTGRQAAKRLLKHEHEFAAGLMQSALVACPPFNEM
jgi:hypothetical protein